MVRSAGLLGAALFSLAAGAGEAHAQSPGDTLKKCLLSKANGDDHVAMVRWVTAQFLANPDVADVAVLDPAKREAIDRAFAASVDRLMLVDCREQTQAAVAAEGQVAIEDGFSVLGDRAGQLALIYPGASAVVGKFADYLTAERWDELYSASPE